MLKYVNVWAVIEIYGETWTTSMIDSATLVIGMIVDWPLNTPREIPLFQRSVKGSEF